MSIRIKSLIFIFLILFLSISIVSFFSIRIARIGLESLAENHMKTLVKSETNKIRTKLELIISSNKSLLGLDDVLSSLVEDDLYTTKISENSYIFIINYKGRVLLHPKREKKLNRENFFKSHYPDVVKLASRMITQKEGFEKFTDEDGPNYVAFLHYDQGEFISGSTKIIPKYRLDWIIGAVIPQKHVLNTVNRIGFISFIVAVFSLLISLLLGFLLVDYGLIKNINKLVNATQLVSNKKYNLDIKINSNDEIGYLFKNFKSMFKQIKKREKERDIAELKLEETRKLLNNIIESMPSVIITITKDGIITQWNQAAINFTGIKAKNALNNLLWDISPVFKKFKKYYLQLLKTKEMKIFYREKFKNFEDQYFDVSLYPLIENKIKGMVIRVDNVTDIEKKDTQLRQAKKMEIVGTLSGGLAHDFNNILGGIIGSLSVMEYKLANNKYLDIDELNEFINIMNKSSKRASDIISQLLTLSRKHNPSFQNVDLNEVLKNTIKICQNTFDKSIEIITSYSKKRAIIKADPIQIEQVLLNLCINSLHAMTIMRDKNETWGGRLAISIDEIYVDKHFCEIYNEAKKGRYWVLSVSDTGIGLDQKIIDKIFDPFFTTKEKGIGTGLGLAMVYNIVKQHNGFIDVQSKKNIGTTFFLYLPKSINKINEISIVPDERIIKGKGMILVVDDEPIIRTLAGKILNQCGYDVILAKNGQEGIDKFIKYNNKLKAVLLDLIMPVKSGDIVCHEMKRINKNVKILLTSGFRKDNRIEILLKTDADGFIQKPYTLNKISQAIYDLENV